VARASDSVDAAEPLDDADGVPVDIVIDQVIAVLKILAFGNAVRGNNKIDFSVLGHGRDFIALFGARTEICKNLVEGGFSKSGAGIAATADERNIDAEVFPGPLNERIVKVSCGICKGGKDKNLLIRLAKLVDGRVCNLGCDEFLEVCKLRVCPGVTF
jgi:hypothetical protein